MVTNMYGPVNSQATRVSEFYGPVETAVVAGVTGVVRAGSPGINSGITFDGEAFYNYVKNTIDLTKTLDYLLMHVGRFGETYTLTLYYSDGTFYAFENGSSQIDPGLYGITWTEEPQYTGDDYIDLTDTTVLMSFSKRIKKIYGSANGQAKIIHQGFGHIDYSSSGYGRVVYYTDSSHTTTRTINLESQSDINGLCAQSVWPTTWNASVQGISIPNTDIKEVYLTRLVSSIPNNFLYYCTSLDNLDFSQTTITTTNPYFVYGCSTLNVPITLPQTLTTIQGTFFSQNGSFNQPFALPSGLTSIGYNFFTGNNSMVSPVDIGSLSANIILADTSTSYPFNVSSSSAAYTNGIPIAGSNRAAWIARFPNLSGTWYRKLIDAGY